MKRKSIAGVIMPIVLILLLFFLLNTIVRIAKLGDLTYSQGVELFEDEKVKSFVVQDDTIELELWEPEEGRDKLTASVSTEVLREDLGQLFLEQRRDGKLETYTFLPDTSPSIVSKALPYALAGLALLLIWGFMNRKANANPAMNFTMARTISGSDGEITFHDVAGCDEEKQELMEVVDFLRDPAKYHEMGATVPKGILLVGPPGTGKTILARAVAGETSASFLSISGSDFMELYVGVGASRVRDLFSQAKQSAPAIIFIDEIDAVGRQRGAGLGGGHDEREQTLNQLLVEMDGFGPNHNVVVLAATNREDILDPALLRPGRFDRQIYVGHPDAKGREEILRIHTRNKRLDGQVDLGRVAMSTSGFTGADLKNLMNEAAILAVREGAPVITGSHIHEAMMKVVAGPEKRSRKQLRRDLEITAIHEAGHAVAMYHLPTHDPVHQISIIPRGRALGVTISMPAEDSAHLTRNQMYEQIVTLLGGRVAEALFCQDISTGASSDIQRATKLARDMVARYGMSERIGALSYDGGSEIFVGRDYEKTKNYSELVAGDLDRETKALIDRAYAHCTRIMQENADKIRAISDYLLENETMTGAQFRACMEGQPIPTREEADLFSAQE